MIDRMCRKRSLLSHLYTSQTSLILTNSTSLPQVQQSWTYSVRVVVSRQHPAMLSQVTQSPVFHLILAKQVLILLDHQIARRQTIPANGGEHLALLPNLARFLCDVSQNGCITIFTGSTTL